MQSEEHFIPFLEAIAHTPLLNDTEKSRPRFLLSAALKNRPGTIATDFAYFTPEGDHRTLHTTPSAHCLLLMFYNPDCTHCRQTIALLHDDRLFKQMLHDGLLTVLAINTENTPETAPRPEAAPVPETDCPQTGWPEPPLTPSPTTNCTYSPPCPPSTCWTKKNTSS